MTFKTVTFFGCRSKVCPLFQTRSVPFFPCARERTRLAAPAGRGKDSRSAEGGHWTEREIGRFHSKGSGWSDSGTPNSLFFAKQKATHIFIIYHFTSPFCQPKSRFLTLNSAVIITVQKSAIIIRPAYTPL